MAFFLTHLYVLIVSKNGHFLNPPTQSYVYLNGPLGGFQLLDLIIPELKSHVISLIIKRCPDTLTMRFTAKPYILWKGLFHRICSKFYKVKHGHDFFLTSGLMKAGRGQKHLSEAKICMKESIYGKKVFNESFSATSKTP